MADPDLPRVAPSRSFAGWWTAEVVGTVRHREVIDRVCAESGWSAHFAFMTLMSAGIAVLGLLLSSPAVVIGAMLISPLMGPIIGLGFGLATFDSGELRRSGAALAVGTVLAVGFCALVTLLSPLQAVTSEIAARTRPNLFDLLVALFSGLAGTYAMIRGRHGAIVGVAIATALMPPLAVIGFGLATANWTVLAGSALLYFTNLMTIGVAAALLARLYGFGHELSPRQTGLQATLIVVIFLALAVPLGLALQRIAWEALASRQAREVIARQFGEEARISRLEIDHRADPVAIEATVFTPRHRPAAEADSEKALAGLLRRPVQVTLEQFRVGLDEAEAEAAELASARGGGSEAGATRVAERLALAAGVGQDEVLVDRASRRAFVRAAELPGATLDSYRALEARVAAAERRWQVTLVPPLVALPDVTFAGSEPDDAGEQALETALWAARRLRLPVAVAGGGRARAELVAGRLTAAGVSAEIVPGPSGAGDPVRLSWRP